MNASEVQELDRATKLAFDRTWLAQERTVLAWVRTATSLITFGFAIYSFFVISTGAGHAMASKLGPRIFSIALICIGLFSLLLAARERRRSMMAMQKIYPDAPATSMGSTVGGLVAALGLLALALLLFRI